MKKIATDTAVRYQTIHTHQAVLILTGKNGVTHRGVILTPGEKQSFVRFNEDGKLRERRVENRLLVPAKCRPKENTQANTDFKAHLQYMLN